MSGAIVLTEYQDEQTDLSIEDAAFVSDQLVGRVTIRRAFSGSYYILNSRQFAGMVTLPSGRRLECRPKVPARNLFFMLAIAFDLPDPFLDAPADVDRMDEVLAVVAAHFTTMVEERINRGLYRAYVEEESNIATVRGRILVAEDLRHNYILRHRTYCRYSEYSWDVPENRVLRQVVRLLAGPTLHPPLRHRLRALDAVMEEITPGAYVAADLDRFAYNRLNDDYRPLHNLCRFFLESTSPSDQSGPFGFQAFLMDMNRLFEVFVTKILTKNARPSLSVAAQATVVLDVESEIRMRPDVLVREFNRVVIVVDCKYKRLELSEHRHHDLYQVLAYCTALGVTRGVLIYPRHLTPVHGGISIRNSEVLIDEVTIDLGGDREALNAECAAMCELVFAMALVEDRETNPVP